MRLYHVTPRRNKIQILREGIRVSMARFYPLRVWLVTRSWVDWAIDDCRQRHGCDDVCVLMCEVRVPRSGVTLGGIVSITRDVPARNVKGELYVEV